MAVDLGWQPVRHWYLHIGYIEFSRVTKSAYDITLTLRRHPIQLGAGYYRPVKRFFWGGGVALGIDYVTEQTSSPDSRLTLSPEGFEIHLALSGYLHMGFQIVAPLSLVLSLGAEIPLTSTQYGIDAIEGERTVLELLPVQPVGILGLRGHFF